MELATAIFVCMLQFIKNAASNETTTSGTTLDTFVEITSTEMTTTLQEFVVVETNNTLEKTASSWSSHKSNQTVASCDKRWTRRDYLLEHPGFPDKYSNNAFCRYSVGRHSSSVCGLEITFRKFDIETSSGCEKDFLAIGDERLCGHIPPQSVVQYPFEEGTNEIAIVFGTNDNVTKTGFQILFQQISVCEEDLNAIPAVHACDVLITDSSGELVTHRSPEDSLGDPVCRYTVGRRHSGFCQVELDFVDFNVDYSPGCIGSYVQLDGHRFCGTSLRGQRKNVTFDVLGNVHVVYKTDTVRMDRGFHLLFRQLACPPGNQVRSPGGTDLVADRLPSSCSKIYSEKEFYMESPGFPNFYPNDLDCQLVIRRYRPSICKMDVRFLDFDVEDSPGCVYDFLQLDSQRLCGRIPEDNVQTTDFLTYEKVIRFKTDSVNPRPGFFLYIRQLDCGTPSVSPSAPGSCDVHVWDKESRVSSPNYPRNYGNDLRCRYTVHRQGDHICHLRITFLDFRLQDGSPGCYHDFLEMDGGWRACGDKFQGVTRTLEFRSPEKNIFFSTDSWVTYPGFLLSLKQLTCSETSEGPTSGRLNGDPPSCDREFEASSFELRSELYPLNYSPGLNCRYLIRKVSDAICQLSITFNHFDMEPSYNCNNDYLSLDGERLCGVLPLNTTKILRFDGPDKALMFRSNGEIQGPGFSSYVRQIECLGGRPSGDAGTSGSVPESNTSSSFNPNQDGSCGKHFTEQRSTFSSPSYPAPYPTDEYCLYAFHMLPGYCKIEFTFLDFFLEHPSPGLPCTRDFLDISGVRYCGQQLHGITKLEPPFGTAHEITLTFVSDSHLTDKGFLASYRQLPCGGAPAPVPPPRGSPSESSPGSSCGGYLTGPYFEVRWPDLTATGDYGQTVQCVYTVHRLGSDTCSLRVTFVTFDFGDGLDCPRQFAQIGDHTLCGRLPSYTIREYDFRDYTMILRMTSSQLPRPRMYLQVQQQPCGANASPPRVPPPNCDETLVGPGFELRSPYYPHGTSTGVDCRYIVRRKSPFICHLEMTFERFALPESRQCYSTHMRIDADRLCGSLSPFTVRLFDFRTEEKLIHFRADHILPGTGFQIRGRQVPCGGSSPSDHAPGSPAVSGSGRTPAESPQSTIRCDQSYGIEDFTLYSPSSPMFYPNDVYCRYVVIRSSSDVCGLEVTFGTFDLEDYYQCQRDYLDIDGEKLCGVLPPQSVRNYVFHPADRTKLIVFRSDHQTTRPGFALRIRQTRVCPPPVPSLLPGAKVPPPAVGGAPSSPISATCEPAYFPSTRGFFRSPSYPSGYPPSHCLFTFVQLRGHCSVRLFFRDFDLLPASDCVVDFLEVEGRRHCDGQLHQLTREVFFPWSDSSTITLTFHSDRGGFISRGFHVDYEQLPCRRQARHHRDEVELSASSGNTTSRSSDWNSSSRFDEDWDDTRTAPRNSTVEYAA